MSLPIGPEEKIQDLFRSFQGPSGEYKYRRRLAQTAVTGAKSLLVDFEDLLSFDRDLARAITERPDEYLEYASKAAWAQLKIEDPEYAQQTKRLFVRFRRLPERISLRKIGSEHLGRLAVVDGIIVRATVVKPLLLKAVFECRNCKARAPIPQIGEMMRGPGFCLHCKTKGFDFVEKESVFINSQEMRIQEKPEDLPPGQLPRSMDIKLIEDLVDAARPGDRVSITGTVQAKQEYLGRRGRLRTFDLYIDANFVEVAGRETEVVELTPEEEKHIVELAKDPWIHRKLLMSLAPSIYGYDDMKEAIMYLLFGGVAKHLPDGVSIRGDVNVLLVGDPGTAKSQLLQYVARVAPRGLYTSGRGSTAAGLTAAVLREKTGGMVLEAGALVLADKGVACIDEIDKMKPDDRVAIHEAMEQQTVSVAKGGIVATLNARACILAAANPALGRYDPYRLISENIALPVTILSRFDLIFVMKDVPESELDAKMSEHILTLHKTGSTPEVVPIPPETLRKYVSYAKRLQPGLTDEAIRELREFYMRMRSVSGGAESPIAITPRQLEALVRLSEARARTYLRRTVTVEDARAIIRLMAMSLQDVGIDTTTGKMDIDIIMTGKPKSVRDKMNIIITTIAEMEKETGDVKEPTLYSALSDRGVAEDEARRIVGQLTKEGILYSPKQGFIKRALA